MASKKSPSIFGTLQKTADNAAAVNGEFVRQLRVDALEEKLVKLDTLHDLAEEAAFIRDVLIPGMGELRAAADEAETRTAASYWPFPTYGDLLFGVK